jgi:hypothetical protein
MARKENIYTMDLLLEYAKIFPENADIGNPDGNTYQKQLNKEGGKFSVNGYFTSEDQIDTLIKGGMDLKPMGNDRIISGNADLGIGKYIKLKRKVDDLKKFTNRNGEEVEIQYGGAPTVVNLTEGRENKRLWDYNGDGLLGNGTKAKVQFELYRDGVGVRLLNVGITEHVPYEDNNVLTEDDELFIV